MEKYNRWTILVRGKSKDFSTTARCDCGTVRQVRLYDVRTGKSKSCGCLRSESAQQRFTKHGESGQGQGPRTAEYSTWAGMLNRCINPNNSRYAAYGGRDINVCRRWQTYENFLEDMGRKPPGTSLERRNNDRNYCPSNCYWATSTEQAHNKRNTRKLTYKGVTLPLIVWARRLGIAHATLRERLQRGWPKDEVFSAEKHSGKSRLVRRKRKG